MTIKLDCPCGQRVAFDVEPEDGRMPMAIPCPACAADLTELANQFIAQHTPPAPAPVRVAVRVSTPAAAAAEGESAPPLTARAAALQRAQIMAQTAAPEKGTPEEETPRISTDEGGKLFRLLKLALAGVGVLIAAWAWFAFVAAKPKVRFTLETPESVPFRHVQWLDDERVFLLTDGKAAVRNLTSDQEVWSQPLAKDEAPTSGAEDFGSSARPPLVRMVAGDFWVALENKLVRFDGATGKRETSVPLAGRVEAMSADATSMIAVTETTPNQRLVTRVELASGKVATETVLLPARSPVASPVNEDGDFFSDKPSVRTEFTASGSGVAALSIRLLERRFITREGVSTVSQAERDAMPVIDRPNLRAMDSTDAARQFLAQTGGGPVEYDESRHAVTLRRLFGGSGQWAGEVVGEPVLFATASADLLVAGTDLRAFDRNCKLLWSAKLSYPASPKALEGNPPPVVEAGSRLFFFDLGTLTAIEAVSGKVAWRLPTIGIKAVAPGPGGALYVATTSAGPEAIKPTEGSGGLDLNNRAHPVLLKVEAASGKVLWQLDRVADQVWPSGKFLYAGRAGVDGLAQMTAAMNGEDAREMFHLRRLNPDNGQELWVWRQSGAPRHFAARDNRLLVLNPRELKLLKFASF